MRLIVGQAALGALQLGAWLARWGRPRFEPHALVDALTMLMLLVAAGVAIAALVALRRTFGVHPRPRDDGYLVQSGVYAHVRHPMYLSVLLVCLLLLLRWPSIPMAMVTAANFVFYLAKARYEERLLLARYPEYARYRARTWGVVPGWPRGR